MSLKHWYSSNNNKNNEIDEENNIESNEPLRIGFKTRLNWLIEEVCSI